MRCVSGWMLRVSEKDRGFWLENSISKQGSWWLDRIVQSMPAAGAFPCIFDPFFLGQGPNGSCRLQISAIASEAENERFSFRCIAHILIGDICTDMGKDQSSHLFDIITRSRIEFIWRVRKGFAKNRIGTNPPPRSDIGARLLKAVRNDGLEQDFLSTIAGTDRNYVKLKLAFCSLPPDHPGLDEQICIAQYSFWRDDGDYRRSACRKAHAEDQRDNLFHDMLHPQHFCFNISGGVREVC